MARVGGRTDVRSQEVRRALVKVGVLPKSVGLEAGIPKGQATTGSASPTSASHGPYLAFGEDIWGSAHELNECNGRRVTSYGKVYDTIGR